MKSETSQVKVKDSGKIRFGAGATKIIKRSSHVTIVVDEREKA